MLGVIAILLIVGFAGVALWLAASYNRLVTLRNRVLNAFAQIDVQLKRRYDLIPNLVETVKGYMSHERQTLEAVIAARNAASSAATSAATDPGNPMLVSALVGAENGLMGAMLRFRALIEAYPQLKADSPTLRLMEELSSSENRVAFARQAYNDQVMTYNTSRLAFPTNLMAGLFGFRDIALFEIADPTQREVVQVKLQNESA